MCNTRGIEGCCDWSEFKNCRDVSLLSAAGKLYVGILMNRVLRMTEVLIDDKQTYTDQKCDVRIKFSLWNKQLKKLWKGRYISEEAKWLIKSNNNVRFESKLILPTGFLPLVTFLSQRLRIFRVIKLRKMVVVFHSNVSKQRSDPP